LTLERFMSDLTTFTNRPGRTFPECGEASSVMRLKCGPSLMLGGVYIF
jgi:hypothetical protein